MTTRKCGCSTETCGCCEGTQVLTPVSTENRPGLGALSYRVGTHGTFLETMKARLANMTLQAVGADGQTIETFRPLTGLTTRDTSDPSIALLDSWATVSDVLTFYQERIANEGYLRTATERRSVLELSRLIGYALRPGVAATVFLAYTLEDQQLTPVDIPQGASSQSIPGPGQLPQTFETSGDLIAHTEWNNLQVRLSQPQNITLDTALTIATVYVAGANVILKAGDLLLLVFGDGGNPSVVRTVKGTVSDFAGNRTEIQLQPVPVAVVATVSALVQFVTAAELLTTATNTSPEGRSLQEGEEILSNTYLGSPMPPAQWVNAIRSAADESYNVAAMETLVETLDTQVKNILASLPGGRTSGPVTNPSQFVGPLLQPPIQQARSSFQLGRKLGEAFKLNADNNAQLLVNFAAPLKDTFYTAWSNANVNLAKPALQAVYAFRVEAPLFGSAVPKIPTYFATDSAQGDPNPHKAGQLEPPDQWIDWPIDNADIDTTLFFDQAYDGVAPSSYVMIQQGIGDSLQRAVEQVVGTQTAQRTAYGISGKTTQLTFQNAWRDDSTTLTPLRAVLVYAQSEELTLVDEPITDDVSGQEIPLDQLYNQLTSGRWVIFSGERADIPGVTGVQAAELLMISGLRQDFDASLPGDTTRTTLLLATSTAYTYKRDTLTIYGNVVKATHGATQNETLGSGDGSQSLQTFVLKQPPLTFVAAPNPSGVDSTLAVYVNNVQWQETETLATLGPKDRDFITKTDDSDKTSVIFGTGENGARLPTGVANVAAVYRNGIGQPGNVDAQQISLLQTRPLGVKSVINPLRASGGADREALTQARQNAPLAVMSLDRLVSVQDYADFSRTFAGIGKAASRRLSDSHRELVHVTIAGADDIQIDPVSDLYQNLVIALRQFGDPSLPVQVDLRELVVLLLSAKVRLTTGYLWDPVAQAIRAAILDTFGFDNRALGQPALLCEVIALIQNIAGVEYVDIDAFGGIPEKTANADGTRRLLTMSEIADTVSLDLTATTRGSITNLGLTPAPPSAVGPAQIANANLADFENGAIRPAQLVIFTSAVADTIVLDQIL